MAIIALGGWNLMLQGQLGSAREFERGVTAVVDVAAQPGSQTAILGGAGRDGPRGIAAVAQNGRIVMAMRDLPPTSGSEVYEAWVIVGDGGPIPIGSFTVASSGIATFAADATPATSGATVAVTREPARGATTPTLPIVASGVAAAPGG